MNQSLDRLYNLLPGIYRQRDSEQGYALQALLQIIAEQMNVVENDIAQLYDNWFIETCEAWVVPYIGELLGYQPAYEAGEPGDVTTTVGQQRNKILFSRRDVANTIGNRRRRGTLAVLARQALDVAGWPARAVEFYTLLGLAQSLTHPKLQRGCMVDLRSGDALARLGGAFEDIAHTVDTRRLTARSSLGRYNIPSVGLFVWRLKSYPVTRRQPFCQESVGPQFYNFSALGNDMPLFTRVVPPAPGMPITDELQVPVPIQRRLFERRLHDFYGAHKSVQIWWIPPDAYQPPAVTASSAPVMIPPENVIVANLSNWQYRTPRGKVAIDPVLGRIAFPPNPHELPRRGIWVTYNYGFSADTGGGEYPRALSPATPETRIYQVGERAPFRRIAQALEQWGAERPKRAFIEITDSTVYVEPVSVELQEGQSLELRATSGSAPVILLVNRQIAQPDSLTVIGKRGSCFVLDGILITGRGMQVSGELTRLCIRHSTLVPGWSLEPNCEPRRTAEASLELIDVDAQVTIEHSIIGSIQVLHNEVTRDPMHVEISDSILDATSAEREAFGAPGWPFAHTVLTVLRSTVFGQIQTHAIALGENSTFNGLVRVARRQTGCMRFCYVAPGSRTPRRYNCQPDLVARPIEEQFQRGEISQAEHDQALRREELRVVPEFNSVRYGKPTYCQLSTTCADEIRRGADDESEMGVFHELFQPQRAANLRSRLRDFTPAGVDAAIIFVN